jgi:hypothetical protein
MWLLLVHLLAAGACTTANLAIGHLETKTGFRHRPTRYSTGHFLFGI